MSSLAAAVSAEKKREVMFLSILGRHPTIEEADTFKQYAASNGDNAYSNLVWALLNTAEFAFVQ